MRRGFLLGGGGGSASSGSRSSKVAVDLSPAPSSGSTPASHEAARRSSEDNTRRVESEAQPKTARVRATSPALEDEDMDADVDLDLDLDVADQVVPDAKKTSKKKKKKKKKKCKTVPKCVKWGDAEIAVHERDVGGCGVPSEGSWSLSLGKAIGEPIIRSIDVYEEQKAARLAARHAALSRRDRSKISVDSLETRQWDFRGDVRNPMFSRLEERGRHDLLLRYADVTSDGGTDKEELGAAGHTDHDDFVERARIHGIELGEIRKARMTGGGCSCSKIVNVSKLSLPRIKEELMNRHLCHTRGHRKELVERLEAALEEEGGLCNPSTCECARAGVVCHGDLCGCCKGASACKKSKGKKAQGPGPGECANPSGPPYMYNATLVLDSQRRILSALKA
jgi:hypothetical protein